VNLSDCVLLLYSSSRAVGTISVSREVKRTREPSIAFPYRKGAKKQRGVAGGVISIFKTEQKRLAWTIRQEGKGGLIDELNRRDKRMEQK